MTANMKRSVQESLIAEELPENIGVQKQDMAPIPQYSLSKILLIWAA